ncbi:unnamed protein product [Chondrus crispus]|uniref:Uncharacterized protein n=1 Tax=Chondrus crispus TaxID=2769 RepID=R7Q8I4_CHOCR|nr:unnamed protein product [Chondrus crispus]CDF34847.1 unnamed protein product [Chondrus crispus]|eukprot:XP_005714666.1 unnamed protein product [Chondrus crispus]
MSAYEAGQSGTRHMRDACISLLGIRQDGRDMLLNSSWLNIELKEASPRSSLGSYRIRTEVVMQARWTSIKSKLLPQPYCQSRETSEAARYTAVPEDALRHL